MTYLVNLNNWYFVLSLISFNLLILNFISLFPYEIYKFYNNRYFNHMTYFLISTCNKSCNLVFFEINQFTDALKNPYLSAFMAYLLFLDLLAPIRYESLENLYFLFINISTIWYQVILVLARWFWKRDNLY